MRGRATALAVVLLAGCSGSPEAVPSGPTRTAGVTTCPAPTITHVPRDLPMADRRLLNLGGGLFGHKVVYQRTTARRLVVTVGEDPLDALEDLDMEERDAVIAGRQVRVSTTRLQPGLVVVALPDELPRGCGEVFALTERLTPAELERVVKGLVTGP